MASGALLGAILAFGVGCNEPRDNEPAGSGAEDGLSEEERAEFVAQICDKHCGVYMDTECNPVPIEGKLFATMAECIDTCIAAEYEAPNGPGYWTDEASCGPTKVAQAECLAGLSCDELEVWYDPLRRHESACADEAHANGTCSAQLPPKNGGEGDGE